MMLLYTNCVNSPQFSFTKQLLEASASRNKFLSVTIFPYFQPIRGPYEYPMAEYDS